MKLNRIPTIALTVITLALASPIAASGGCNWNPDAGGRHRFEPRHRRHQQFRR